MRAYVDIRVGPVDLRAGWCWLVAAWRGRGFGTGFGRSSEETARVVARDVMRSYLLVAAWRGRGFGTGVGRASWASEEEEE